MHSVRIALRCLVRLGRTLFGALGEHSTPVHVLLGVRRAIQCAQCLVHSVVEAMMSMPWFHACTSCKANMPLSDKHPLCMQCLGVQHATEAMGREDFCNFCTAFQPRVRRNRLRRAMGIDIQSPTAKPSAALGAPSPLLQLSQSPFQEIPCDQALVPKPHSSHLQSSSREARQLQDDLPEEMEEPVSCTAVIQESGKGTRRREEVEGLVLWKEKLTRELRTEIRTGLATVEALALPDRDGNASRTQARSRPPRYLEYKWDQAGWPICYVLIQKQWNRAFLECEKEEQRRIGSQILGSAKLDQGESLWVPQKSQMTIWGKVKGSATVPEGQMMVENRQRREGELEQPGWATALGTRATRVEFKSGDKPANEKGCEGESQRTRTLKWSLRY
ncbi:UNVERIFIED_CONTAM: hypothetical protein FKN15_007932 [Acipenser sinensis]